MTDEVSVVNQALYHIGDKRIASLAETSERAKVANEFFEQTRDEVLQAYAWRFARTRTTLAALADAPAFRWTTQYQLPSDYLALVQVNDYYPYPSMSDARTYDDKVWDVEDGKILTDLSAPLKVIYRRRITDMNAWTPLARGVLAYTLAMRFHRPLAGKGSIEGLRQEMLITLDRALLANEIDAPADAIADDTWVLSRYL